MVVSFIAPHSLTARALVIAPGDVLTLHNRSRAGIDIAVDGRPAGEIAPEESIEARFVDGVSTLVQRHGSNFYRRLREKFGQLAQ
jgi:NAD+ kinase